MLKTSCRYKVDANDIIIVVEGAWAACARRSNRAASEPVGRPIWDYIQGLSTRNIYRVLMKQVRQTGATVRFPFRVDQSRCMEMKMSPGREKSVWFQTACSPHPAAESQNGRQAKPQRESTLVNMCAWCNLVSVEEEWLTLENAIRTLGLFDTPEAPPISHGICQACAPQLKFTPNQSNPNNRRRGS